jgi:serine/threonine protein kinase
MINTTIGKYKITRLIGEGGMASVYEAEHEMLGTKVAIKVLNPMLSANAQIKERFRNEAKLMASLDHPNITKMIDFDEQPQQLSIVIEYLNGEDLNQNIKRNGPLSEKEIKDVFSQTLSAFQYAHEKGIVHRDIKPSNIFILPNGHVKILDFGIAKLFGQGNEMTHTGTQMGTPIYMSPEQVKADKSIDHRSDIYSLGVTLFFVINGKPPYNSDTDSQFDIFNKIVYEPLPEFSIQSKFKDIVLKACQKNREFRYQGCDDILSELNLKGIIKSDEKTIVNNTSKSHLQHDKTVLAKRSINNYDNQSAHPKKKPPRLNSRRKVILAIIFLVITVSGGMLGMVYQDFLSNQAQEIDIPDANFKAFLVGNVYINTNGDDEIQASEASAYTGGIYCHSIYISSLTGIEAFTALTELDCSDQKLTSLDVSKNTALTYLDCGSNKLTSLDVSKNTALTDLWCHDNQLTSLDVSKNTALTYLWCDDNQLTSLDFSKNTALTELTCEHNKLTFLDVSKNTALTYLYCPSNKLTSLDVSKNTALTYLYCGDNKLTSLDVSKNTALYWLDCEGNQFDCVPGRY